MKTRLLRGFLALLLTCTVVLTLAPLQAQAAAKLPAPKGVKAATVSTTSVKVSWSKVSGAKKYELYQATSAKGKFTKIKTTTSTSYTKKSLTKGKTYYYKVKAIASKSSRNSGYSAVVSAKTRLATPTGLAVTAISPGSVALRWGKVSGAKKYEVYRATSAKGSYKKVTTTSSTTFANKGLTSGKTYYYKVRALYSSSSLNSAYSTVVSAKTGFPRASVKSLGKGSVTRSRPTKVYSYTAPRSGTYRLDAVDRTGDNNVYVRIFDAAGNRITSSTNGLTVDLTAGKKYRIEVSHYSNPCSFKLNVGIPHMPWDITGRTEASDSIRFDDQINTYNYVAPRDGRYRIDLVDRTHDTSLNLRVSDSLDRQLGQSRFSGLTVDLKKGESYKIFVSEYSSACDYRMVIGVPHETKDLSALTSYNDKISYADQVNWYTYRAPITGRYRVEAVDRTESKSVKLIAYNALDQQMEKTYYNGLTLDLEAGKVYKFAASYYSGTMQYRLTIGVPHPVKTVTSGVGLPDRFDFTDQINRYDFVAPASGDYDFYAADRSGNTTVNLYVYDDLSRLVKRSFYSGDTVTLEAGKRYRIEATCYYTAVTYTFYMTPAAP